LGDSLLSEKRTRQLNQHEEAVARDERVAGEKRKKESDSVPYELKGLSLTIPENLENMELERRKKNRDLPNRWLRHP